MDEARKAVNQALKADPTNTAALLLRARLAIDGPGDSAAADVNLGLMLAPSDPNLLATRAYLLHDDNKSELALRDANAAVTLDSDNPDARWVRAVILMKRRQLDAAEHDLTHALLVEPTGLRTRTFRAMVRLRANRYRDAIEDATGVLQQSPSNPDVLQVRAISRMALGENEGAIADLNRILGEPGEPSTAGPAMGQLRQLFLQRAVVSARIGRPRDAMRDLETVINFGGRPALLALQVHLRRHGFRDLPLDGKRTPALDDAAQACFVNQACGRGLAVGH
jgi:Flp pilus assembly protein TadD